MSALAFAEESLAAAADLSCKIVLMHAQGDPKIMQLNPCYFDVVEEVLSDLNSRIAICERAGIDRARLIADPGIGFGKTLDPAGRRLLDSFSRNVATRLAVFEPSGKKVRDIALPTLGSGYFVGGTTWNSDEVFYEFESFAQPWTIYRYDLATAKQSVWDRPNIPINSDAIATTQVWYTSKDGTRVPMFVVAEKKGASLSGDRPTLLRAYGGFGAIETPYFDEKAAMWVASGGIYALANIRGGGELGENWHRDGMLENKQKSFDDFIAAAEWLIANKYTRAKKLASQGIRMAVF